MRELEIMNHRKAKALYDYLDSSKLFANSISAESRSYMNVTFKTESDEPVSYTHLDVYKRQLLFHCVKYLIRNRTGEGTLKRPRFTRFF